MHRTEQPNTTPARARAEPQSGESVWSLAAFWLIAFAAAGLLAAVLVAPKWEEKQLLQSRARDLALQCQYLSDRSNHLERVIEAFRHDPDFTSEIARTELDYGLLDEQRLLAPVRNWKRSQPPRPEPPTASSWTPLVRLFAHDQLVRRTSLLTATVFTLVGLACFNAPREPSREDSPLCRQPAIIQSNATSDSPIR